MNLPTLRPYQNEAVQAVVAAWDEGIQRPVLVLATGLGKTVIMSDLIADCVRQGECQPVLLVHRDELVRQSVEKLLPHAKKEGFTIGVIQANRHEVDADVVVASVQTLSRRVGTNRDTTKFVSPNRFNVIITDECHHASANSYLKIYDHFGGRDADSGVKMLGVTATLARGDGVPLGHVWDKVVFERGILFGIDNDYLVRPRSFRAELPELDLAKVKTLHGDWSDGDLGGRMMKAGHRIGEAVLKHGRREDGQLRRGIVFAPTIDCAQGWVDDFNELGIVSRLVIGDTAHDLRQAIYRATASGLIDMIVSVMCLTEGFDLPAVEMAVIGRPTKKLPLYIQMVGRVLRPSSATGKQDAIILDVCGVMGESLAISLADLELPAPCECTDCDCMWRYLCMAACGCPMNDAYVVEHDGCTHVCRQGSQPSGPQAEVVVDDAEIKIKEIDLFGVQQSPRGWLTTTGPLERPFLPGGSNRPTVFLAREGEAWSVGFYEGYRPVERLDGAVGVSFAEAAVAAERLWGSRPAALRGPASESQVAILTRNAIEFPDGVTKQQASVLISRLFATRRIDK